MAEYNIFVSTKVIQHKCVLFLWKWTGLKEDSQDDIDFEKLLNMNVCYW